MADIIIEQDKEEVPKKVIAHGKLPKRTMWSRIKGAIFVAGAREIKESLIEDVVKPTIKDFLADVLYATVDVALYGRSAKRGRKGGRVVTSNGRSVVDYSAESTRNRNRREARRTSSGYDFRNIYFEDRYEADEVFDALVEEIQDKGEASVYYFYELCGVTAEYTDQQWGWKDLSGTGYDRGPEGIALLLPKPVYLKR